jgi:hypothetical protein
LPWFGYRQAESSKDFFARRNAGWLTTPHQAEGGSPAPIGICQKLSA